MAKTKSKLKLIDDPIYGYWRALYMSFYSGRLYIDVGKRWRGFGGVYLLLMIALLSIPYALKTAIDFNKAFNQQILEPLKQLPTIYVQNGIASLDKPMPYLIKNSKKQVIAIVDTTGAIEQFDNKYPQLAILVNKDRMFFRIPAPQFLGLNKGIPSTSSPIAQLFDPEANLVFNGENIIVDNHILQLEWISQILIYPIVVAMLFSIFIVLLLVLGFLGQVFARIFFAFYITFRQGSRLLIIAATPMMLLLMSMLTMNSVFPGSGAILMSTLAVYFSFAIYSLKAESKRMVTV